MDNATERTGLLAYLPEFMQQFLEFKEIMRAEDREMDEIGSNIQVVFNNSFIESCNGYGIQKYEKLLGIKAAPQDALEWRVARVLAQWDSLRPFTYPVLLKKLDTLCGAGNYTVGGNLEDYWLSIGVLEKFTGQTGEVENLLDKILPQNISYEVFEERPITGSMYVGAVMQQAEIVNIRQVV